MSHVDMEIARRFVRGAVTSGEREAIRDHVEHCADCRALVNEERSLSTALRLDEAAPPSQAALERLLDRVEAIIPPRGIGRRDWRRLGRAGLVFAGCAAALLIYVMRFQPAEEARLGREIGLTPREASRVVGELEALCVLRGDSWVANDFETVAAFARLLDQPAAGAP